MDAARPALEPLPDLPVDEPMDGARPPPAPAPTGPLTVPADSAPASAPPKPAQPLPGDEGTGTLTMLKPEMLIAGEDAPAAAPAATTPPPEEGPQVLELDPDAPLSLEEPQVEKMLTTPAAGTAPPPVVPTLAPAVPELTLTDDFPREVPAPGTPQPVSPAPVPPAPVVSAPALPAAAAAPRETADATPAKPAAEQDAPPPATLVPLAKRASLSAAAHKLAAAGAAGPRPVAKPKPVAATPAPQAPTQTPGSAAPATASATAAPPAKAVPTAKPQVAAKPQPAAAAEAPSLAAWASARAAAAPPPARAAGTPAVKSAAPAAKPSAPAPVAPPKTNGGAAAAAAAAAPASIAMDRDFIARNQVVERYLSGRLPIKAATDFERYCKGHPALLDEIGLPERVNAGLRLLEAAGKPEPWQEPARALWQRPGVTMGIAAAAVVLAISLALVAALGASKSRKISELQGQVHDRVLDPATSTRTVRLLPNRSGASNSPAITIGGGSEAQLVDFRIDETRSPYRDFRITIDRIDQGRVMVIDNLTKDSNGHLRLELNTSALGPGNYQLTIEGLTLRLEPQPDSWVTIGVAARPVQQ